MFARQPEILDYLRHCVYAGVERRRLSELVPRRARPQQHDLAGLHVAVLAADAQAWCGGLRVRAVSGASRTAWNSTPAIRNT